MGEIINLNDYRHPEEPDDSSESEPSQYSESDKQILDGLVAHHPAERAIAEKEFHQNPDLVAKFIIDMLKRNKHPESIISSVLPFKLQLEQELTGEVSSNEISSKLLEEYENYISPKN